MPYKHEDTPAPPLRYACISVPCFTHASFPPPLTLILVSLPFASLLPNTAASLPPLSSLPHPAFDLHYPCLTPASFLSSPLLNPCLTRISSLPPLPHPYVTPASPLPQANTGKVPEAVRVSDNYASLSQVWLLAAQVSDKGRD